MNSKHSTIKRNYEGILFGMLAMCNIVKIGAITLVRMKKSKVAVKRYFFDILEFSL